MFDIHLGDRVRINASTFQSPAIVLGQVGQGRSTALLKTALELIKNKQTGLLYDPFGDLAEDLKNYIQTEELKTHVKILSQEKTTDFVPLLKNYLVIVHGSKLDDGSRYTRTKGQEILKQAYKNLTTNDWLVIDEAWEYLDDELLANYLNSNGPKSILSSQSFVGLSKQEREQMYVVAKNLLLYKTRRIDGNWIEQFTKGVVKSSDIAAIKQYHYLYLDEEDTTYDAVPWPIEKI